MRKFFILTTVLFMAGVVLAFSPPPTEPVTSASALNGVWTAVHVAFASSDTSWAQDQDRPNINIFTDGYWSVTRIRGDGPRADLPEEDATDEQRLEAWRRFAGSAGTYTVSGSTLNTRTLVAKTPNAMSGDNTNSSEFWVKDGKLTRVFKNDENGNTWTVTFKRVE